MPSKYIIRNLRENSVYHIYNRGTVEQGLFCDAQDFKVFLYYLYVYTTPVGKVMEKYSDLPKRIREKTLAVDLNVLAFVLMPDHYHLVVRQIRADGLPRLMKQVVNGFTAYYNQKYKHQGAVFAGRYKAVEVTHDQVPDLVRYIHTEPKNENYEWSSLSNYRGGNIVLDCDTQMVMNILGTQENFIKFQADREDYTASLERLKGVVIETI